MRKNHLVEIFVERHCSACEEVLRVVVAAAERASLTVSVFDRESNPEVFQERRVFITPATLVDGVLAFYGSFSADELQHYIYSRGLTTHLLNNKGVEQCNNIILEKPLAPGSPAQR